MVAAEPAGKDHRHNGRILIVEDNALIRDTLLDQLERLGYDVIAVDMAAKAMLALENGVFDLVVSDVLMPGGMSGADLAREIGRRWPDTSILLMSGYTALEEGGMPPDAAFLSKPYSGEDLRAMVRMAMAKAEARRRMTTSPG